MAGMFDDLIPSGGARSAPTQRGMFDDLVPQAQAPGMFGGVKDVARSIEAGGDRGLVGLLGLPADAARLAIAGKDYADAFLSGRSYAGLKAERDAKALVPPEQIERFGSAALGRSLETLRGPEYTPQTTAGKYARTAAEFTAQSALMPGGSLARNALAFGVAPGLASEAAGQATEGTAVEPWARAGAGLAVGLGAGMVGRPGGAAARVVDASGNLAPAERQAALGRFDQIMGDAQANGIPLSPAFAWDAATNGASDMAGLFRHAEAMGRMRGFNAQMPGAVETAGRTQFDRLAPPTAMPTLVGEQVSDAARTSLDASPVGRNVEAAVAAVGPRVTADQAGQVIQRELAGVRDAREAVRSQQGNLDYEIARNAPERVSIDRTATEEVSAPRFGQINPQAAVDEIDDMLRTAKGNKRTALQTARTNLLENRVDPVSGVRETDLSVEGLLNARYQLDPALVAAREAGDGHLVRGIGRLRSTLDAQLKQAPEVAQADANYAANSIPLQPFDNGAPLGRVTQQDERGQRFLTPSEEVPSNFQGATAARDLLANGTPEARQALEGRMVTQIMDGARGFDGRVSVDRLRTALRENEDVLAQMPEVGERLARVVDAQVARDRLNGTMLGRLAARDQTTAKAIDIMFPRGGEVLAGIEREVGAAVSELVRVNPEAARQLVRLKVENLFNAARKDLQGGANQVGGAKFRQQLVGNPQEAANLAAATRALPNGDVIADGFGRFLDVLAASGRRQNVGSRTAYNDEFIREARDGGRVEEAARLAAGGFVKFPAKVQERLERWRLGRNVDELARLFSDPDAVGAFRGLVAADNRGGSIVGPMARLTAIAARASQQGQPLQVTVRPGESR